MSKKSAFSSFAPTSLGEGIPFSEYKLRDLILALPVGLALEAFFSIQRLFTTDLGLTGPLNIPRNALIVTFHGDSYLDPLSIKTWKHLLKGPYCWLGYHGFLSYIGSFRAMLMGIRSFRYQRNAKIRPIDQVREFLKNRQSGQLMLRTDAGGPYGKVRPSTIKLAIEFARPIVCLRVTASKFLSINGHKIAVPRARIKAGFSRPIEAATLEELAKDSIDCACQYVEEKMKETLPKI